jgi:LacI family transcriptional regulator
MSITVIDVAQEAGVSRTTVSNVFSGKGKFSDETRQAVLAAAKKLGYKPNLAARSLITNQSRLIGLILPSYVDTNTLANNPFYNIIMDSAYAVLRDEAYYDLIIFSVPHREKLTQVSEWLDARNVDGILAVGEYEQDFLADLDSKSVPVVLIDNYSSERYANFSYVNSDDESGGYLATRHLIAKGYAKIALCAVDLASPLMQRRYQGYHRAMLEAGLAECVFDQTGAPFEAGLHFAEALITQGMDAAFCTEDMAAVGIIHGMMKNGVQASRNFGLVGFDNLNVGRQVYPELTTVDQSIFRKGEMATKMLLEILNHQATVGKRLVLPVTLIIRETA